MDNVPENVKKKFHKVCSCKKVFSASASYYRHKKICPMLLKSVSENKSYNYICKEKDCNYTAKFSKDFSHHLQNVHKINCYYECKVFNNYSEFEIWKDKYEKNTNSYYILRSDKKSVMGNIKYFYCNRSGNYQSKCERKRGLRKQGLSKIGSNCTSHMKVIYNNKDYSTIVYIQHTHYGHNNDVAFIRIPKADRNILADLLIKGLEIPEILQNLISQDVENVQRTQLCTKRDLLNISRSYGIERVKNQSQIYDTDVKDTNLNCVNPVISNFNKSVDDLIDSTNISKNFPKGYSDVESVEFHLFPNTLNLFEKVKDINDKNSLLKVEEQLDYGFLATEITSALKEDTSVQNNSFEKIDSVNLCGNDLLENHFLDEDYQATESKFQDETDSEEEFFVEYNINDILDIHAYSDFVPELKGLDNAIKLV